MKRLSSTLCEPDYSTERGRMGGACEHRGLSSRRELNLMLN
jgi:hypothetical protein